ncbi:MAG: hypothetical protein AAGE65_07650 [Planctomycetota bacterium]
MALLISILLLCLAGLLAVGRRTVDADTRSAPEARISHPRPALDPPPPLPRAAGLATVVPRAPDGSMPSRPRP